MIHFCSVIGASLFWMTHIPVMNTWNNNYIHISVYSLIFIGLFSIGLSQEQNSISNFMTVCVIWVLKYEKTAACP